MSPRIGARLVTRALSAQVGDGYDPDDEVNLAGYTGSLTTYGAVVTALAAGLRATGRELPEAYATSDVVVGGIATHKFSRLLARGSVTSPIRAPFTEFEKPAGSAEHIERPRGSHLRHTVGELLSCPFCLDVWVGTAYVAGLAVAPRLARTWAAVFGVVGVADALQHGYARLRGD